MATTKKATDKKLQAKETSQQCRKSKIAEFWDTRYVPGEILDRRAVLK